MTWRLLTHARCDVCGQDRPWHDVARTDRGRICGVCIRTVPHPEDWVPRLTGHRYRTHHPRRPAWFATRHRSTP